MGYLGRASVDPIAYQAGSSLRSNFPQISDADGELKMETVAEGEIQQSMLDPNDVFLVDLGTHLYVWVGDG